MRTGYLLPYHWEPGFIRQTGVALVACLLIGVGMVGCGDDGNNSGTPAVTRDNYEVLMDERGTPLDFDPEGDLFKISPRLPRVTLHTNICSKLELSDTKPRLIISGHQSWEDPPRFQRARDLRVDTILTPPGTNMLQIDVSLGSLLELRGIKSSEKGSYTPGPILHDNIGSTYWPVGYFLKDGSKLEINIDPANSFKDLNELPYLSRSKSQILTLVFHVNKGVTITGYSYGGHDKRTFEVLIPKR